MISYYSTYQSTAKTDIQRLVEKLKALNSTKGEEWEKIMKYGDYVNTDMNVNVDGLPNDDSLCITVLGVALNANGLDENRLIVENKSKSTVQNAQFTGMYFDLEIYSKWFIF